MSAPVTRRTIISLAWPLVLANAAIPLHGLADTAAIGNTGSVADLGALLFSFLFGAFGFLRMGTTGFAA